MITVNNVKKIFEGNIVAVDNVSFHIPKNQVVAIVGASGSGKSTLLNILGMLEEYEGEYLLDGKDIGILKDKEKAILRNQKIGFVFQNSYLDLESTVFENISVPLIVGKKKKYQEKIFTLLQELGLETKIKVKASKLSGGERQRVALARALINDADLILADEPCGALDSLNASKIMDLLIGLKEKGKTVLIVTHNEEAAKLCERIITLKDGKIVGDETTQPSM